MRASHLYPRWQMRWDEIRNKVTCKITDDPTLFVVLLSLRCKCLHLFLLRLLSCSINNFTIPVLVIFFNSATYLTLLKNCQPETKRNVTLNWTKVKLLTVVPGRKLIIRSNCYYNLMAITLQVTLIVSIIVSSSIVLGASIPLLNSGASVNSGVSSSGSNGDNQSHVVSSKTFIGPYESLFLSRLMAPEGAPDAIEAADALTSLLADQVNLSPKYSPNYSLEDDSLFPQQLSPSAR